MGPGLQLPAAVGAWILVEITFLAVAANMGRVACMRVMSMMSSCRFLDAGIVLAVFITTFLTSFAMQFRVSRWVACPFAVLRGIAFSLLPCACRTSRTSGSLCMHIQQAGHPTCRGLEQQVALPRDSYLQHYFADVTSVMRVGPPLFFVVSEIVAWYYALACLRCAMARCVVMACWPAVD